MKRFFLVFSLMLILYHCIVSDGAESDVQANGTANSSIDAQTSRNSTRATEWPFIGSNTINSTNGTDRLLANWFSFKARFGLQCLMVFAVLLVVMLLCFIPDEPMFDITYNKYDTNEIAKRASSTSLKVGCRPGTSIAAMSAAGKKAAAAYSKGQILGQSQMPK